MSEATKKMILKSLLTSVMLVFCIAILLLVNYLVKYFY